MGIDTFYKKIGISDFQISMVNILLCTVNPHQNFSQEANSISNNILGSLFTVFEVEDLSALLKLCWSEMSDEEKKFYTEKLGALENRRNEVEAKRSQAILAQYGKVGPLSEKVQKHGLSTGVIVTGTNGEILCQMVSEDIYNGEVFKVPSEDLPMASRLSAGLKVTFIAKYLADGTRIAQEVRSA